MSFQAINKIPLRVLRYSSVHLTKYALRRGLLITILAFCYAFFAKWKVNAICEDHFPPSIHDLIKDSRIFVKFGQWALYKSCRVAASSLKIGNTFQCYIQI
jgi:hypothetical protein